MDIGFDFTTGQTRIENRDLVLVEGIEEVAQRVFTVLDTFRGTYVFDTRLGFPWVELVFSQRPLNEAVVVAELRRTVKRCDSRIVSVDIVLELNETTRALSVSMRVVVDTGEAVSVGVVADPTVPTGVTMSWVSGVASGVFPGR